MEIFIDILGWMGSATYLLAFALNSAKKVTSDSFIYQGMNIFAGIVMTYYTFSHGAYSATALNSVWAIIGVATLVNRKHGGRVVPPAPRAQAQVSDSEERIETTK